MAAYCEIEELGRWGISADALEDVQDPDSDAAIAGASDLIDSYLRSRFTLPLVAWGDDLRRACAIIAVYDLMQTRGYNPAEPEDKQLEIRYRDVIRWLERISSGQAVPTVTDSSSGAQSGVSSARAQVVSNSQRGWYDRDGNGGPFSGGR